MEISQEFSDDNLRVAILSALAADERTSAANLRVGVLNGVAHLAGPVDTLAIRTAAEELVKGMQGVRGVVNRIDAPGAPSPAREINLDIKTENKLQI